MPLEIVRNDITKMKVDAIVNAANSALAQGGGVCGAIFAAAGSEALKQECDRIGHCDVGTAVITKGYGLPAKHIIHTVGPVWQGGGHREEELLTACYTRSLALALDMHLESVAFPLISSGIFGYPKDKALQTAISAIGAFLMEHDIMVYLVVFDKAAYVLSDKLFNSIKEYIDDHYVDTHTQARPRELWGNLICESMSDEAFPRRGDLDDVLLSLEKTFSQKLLQLIDEKGKTDPEVYKRANIDRKLFSKIRSNAYYNPSKNTALALAVALELNLEETSGLLACAGFAFSPCSKFDVIVEYFIRHRNWDIFQINEALFAFDQSLLGA